MHIGGGRGGAGPYFELAVAIGDGPAVDAVLQTADEEERHEHPRVVVVAEGVPVARMREAVVVFLEVSAEPGVVVAEPANGLFEVVVAVFETFYEDVAGEGAGLQKAEDEREE